MPAGGTVYKQQTVTRVFKTLREMADGMTIEFEDLEFVEKLGGVNSAACLSIVTSSMEQPLTDLNHNV